MLDAAGSGSRNGRRRASASSPTAKADAAALAVTTRKYARPIRRSWIAGVVASFDFALFQLHWRCELFRLCVRQRLELDYVAAIFAMSAAAVVCFQAAGHLPSAGVSRRSGR